MMLCSQLITALLENGTADLMSRCHFMPGVPVKPMLAKVGGEEVCGEEVFPEGKRDADCTYLSCR